MRVKSLAEPVAVEPPRSGEDAGDCVACNTPDDAYIWVSERWRVRGMDRPTGLPMVLILECRSHLDIGDLPNLLAAELGVMTVRLERAIRSLDGVARVHVNRWGDGSAHLHMWFLARPYGRLQLRGTFLSLWDDLLPVIPEEQWLENLSLVAEWLAGFGGRAIAEPAHIHWQSPSTFGNEPTSQPDATGAADASEPSTTPSPESGGTSPATPSDLNEVNAETRDLSSYASPATTAANAPDDEPAGSSPKDETPAATTQEPHPEPGASSATSAQAEDGQVPDASGTGTASPTAEAHAPINGSPQSPGTDHREDTAMNSPLAEGSPLPAHPNAADTSHAENEDPPEDTTTTATTPTPLTR
jgi:hypothetical protein